MAWNSYVSGARTRRRGATFSIAAILAVIAAIASFFVGPGLGILLAIVAIVLGAVGFVMALMPGVRGGVASLVSIGAGLFGVIAALIRVIF